MWFSVSNIIPYLNSYSVTAHFPNTDLLLTKNLISISDRMGFTSSMHFANLPNMDDNKLKVYIQKQVC